MQAAQDIVSPVAVDRVVYALKQMNAIKTLLIICSPGTISAAMTAAIEHEFPWLSVVVVHDLRFALVELEHPVELVLADSAFAPTLNASWSEFESYHHEATPALICNDDDDAVLQHKRARSFERLQGIVPFNVNLDVFLAALRIILRGGRYFPERIYQPRDTLRGPSDYEISDRREATRAVSELRAGGIEKLTKRENEILACIAVGNQNKIIAATLGLSEHTVKIHIHNIITKLGVHNRTEVVARYFEYRRKENSSHESDQHDPYTGATISGEE